MKKLAFLVCVFLMISSQSNSQTASKLNDSELNAAKVEFARKFASDYLNKLKSGSYYNFQDEAIDPLKNQLTENTQKLIYKQLKMQFGDFQSLEFAEAFSPDNNPAIVIYRFKGKFDKANENLEIRVVLNEAGKIAGFWIKKWLDELT